MGVAIQGRSRLLPITTHLSQIRSTRMNEWFDVDSDRDPSPLHSTVGVLFIIVLAVIIAGIIILATGLAL